MNGFQQFQTGKLEKLDRLLQLGSHDQLLAEFELLSQFKCCHAVASSRETEVISQIGSASQITP